MQKDQRLLDLAAFLLKAAEPVSWREIQEQFPEDYGGRGEAAIRKFERDKADLLELGIPVRYVAGDEDLPAGYLIDRDEFYLPDLKLPPEDLALLYLAGSAALASGTFPYARDLAHALNKLSFAARAPGASEAAGLAARQLSAPEEGDGVDVGARVEELSRAIAHVKRVHLVYLGAERGAATERDVDPYGLFQRGGAWFLAGWCHLRRAIRTFHLSRIVSLTVNASAPRTRGLRAAPGLLARRARDARDLGVRRPRPSPLPHPARPARAGRGRRIVRAASEARGGRRRHARGGRGDERGGAAPARARARGSRGAAPAEGAA